MELSGVQQHADFRSFLQSELMRRCKSNPRYSLRAFARMLEVEPSFLSKILNRKRSVTETTLLKFSRKMGLKTEEIEKFRTSLASLGSERAIELDQASLDQFQMIADWHHFAILELVAVKGFRADAKWVARVLGLSLNEVNQAVDRLVRLGYLEITPRGRWLNRSSASFVVGCDFTPDAVRRLQRQVLEGALRALEETSPQHRDRTSVSSMTMAIDSRLLPEAKERIRKFRGEMAKFLRRSGSWDEVYQLGVCLFPVSKAQE